MRDFFKTLLRDLKRLCGLNQFQTLQESANAKEEIAGLLDVLCRVADQYPMIPDADKQKIIENGVIHDSEFTGLNARVIARWLNQHKERYQTMAMKTEQSVGSGKVLTPDEYAPYLEQWLAEVKKIGNPDVSPEQKVSDMRKRFYGKDDGPALHKSTTMEEYEARQLEFEERKAKRIEELRAKHPTLSIDELNLLL